LTVNRKPTVPRRRDLPFALFPGRRERRRQPAGAPW